MSFSLTLLVLSCLKRKCVVDIPHIPDRCLWSSHWWTHCSHTTLAWLHYWGRKYKLFEMWPVYFCMCSAAKHSWSSLPQWILMMMFVIFLGALGNHPLLLAGYWAQCYHFGTGFRLVCSTGFSSHLLYMCAVSVSLFTWRLRCKCSILIISFSPESNS